MPLEIKGHWIRQRVRPPSAFLKSSFRTQRIGKHLRIAGRLKASGRWATQAFRHPVSELRGTKCAAHKCTGKALAKAFKMRRHV